VRATSVHVVDLDRASYRRGDDPPVRPTDRAGADATAAPE
jgi:hypothetical protein